MSEHATSPHDSDLRIYFPVRGQGYSYRRDLAHDSAFRTELLKAQRDHQQQSRNPDRYARCLCCNNPKAQYVVKALKLPNDRIHYFLARFSNSGHHHADSCKRFKDDILPLPTDNRPPPELRPGDLSALVNGARDPSLRPKREVSSVKTSGERPDRPQSSSTAASLRMLGRILLEESGVCTCAPGFVNVRGFREVNGLVLGALKRLRDDPTEVYGQLLMGVKEDVPLGPWSMAVKAATITAAPVPVCLGFGFVVHISPPTPTGEREFTLENEPATKIVVARSILAKAAKVPNFPTSNEQLRHPTWAIVIAARFDGRWKAITLALFRMTKLGLVPVESDPEEAMVNYLISERRVFRRWLRPPETDCGYIPDFELLDTESPHYIEVAGRTDKKYLRQLEMKRQRWREKVTIWHTAAPLPELLPAKNKMAG